MGGSNLHRHNLSISMVQAWYEQYRKRHQGKLPPFDDLTAEEFAVFSFNMGALCERRVSEARDIERNSTDKLFVTKILNDLHRHGFHGGKAKEMLHHWARELRVGTSFPRSRLKAVFSKLIGKNYW